MLNSVPTGINNLVRGVVLNHPNTFNCEVYRKETVRKAPNDENWGGEPTLGGLGQLDGDDEPAFKFVYCGAGFALPAETFQPSALVDKNDANIGYVDEFRFLIEPARLEHIEGGWFDIHTHDLVMLLLFDGEHENPAKLAFEVVGRETTSNIPPFTPRYICNRRDEYDIDVFGKFVEPDKVPEGEAEDLARSLMLRSGNPEG